MRINPEVFQSSHYTFLYWGISHLAFHYFFSDTSVILFFPNSIYVQRTPQIVCKKKLANTTSERKEFANTILSNLATTAININVTRCGQIWGLTAVMALKANQGQIFTLNKHLLTSPDFYHMFTMCIRSYSKEKKHYIHKDILVVFLQNYYPAIKIICLALVMEVSYWFRLAQPFW